MVAAPPAPNLPEFIAPVPPTPPIALKKLLPPKEDAVPAVPLPVLATPPLPTTTV
ncbi:MAG: hypothetical protein M0D53_03680 [Flavobacterium sp. JAD_PAG50586_2]|nr:MAG: hypothetical protein M0D53_03680 [Flavobacterium sp. JAD_PAG50586_2]